MPRNTSAEPGTTKWWNDNLARDRAHQWWVPEPPVFIGEMSPSGRVRPFGRHRIVGWALKDLVAKVTLLEKDGSGLILADSQARWMGAAWKLPRVNYYEFTSYIWEEIIPKQTFGDLVALTLELCRDGAFDEFHERDKAWYIETYRRTLG